MKLKLTNRLNLPLPIVEAIANDPYSAGDSDYTATSLMQPPRMRRLLQLYPEHCVEDVADVLPRLQGQTMHVVLERAAGALEALGYVVEKRFYATFAHNDSIKRVSAQIDLFDPARALLQDYKFTSVAAVSHGLKDEYRFQLNLQAYLLHKHGFQVETAETVNILRDWSPERADRDPSYPQEPVVKLQVALLLPEEVEAWVLRRIEAQESAAKETEQPRLPLCTPEETWARTDDDVFAVVKPGAARALKLVASRAAAEELAAKHDARVEQRFGKATRCARYCPAASVCEQWKVSPRNPANGSQEKGTPKQGKKRADWDLPEGFEQT